MPEKLKQSYREFHDAMISNGVVDAKTTFMIQMGVAMALGCYPCMEILGGMAKERACPRRSWYCRGHCHGCVGGKGLQSVSGGLQEVRVKVRIGPCRTRRRVSGPEGSRPPHPDRMPAGFAGENWRRFSPPQTPGTWAGFCNAAGIRESTPVDRTIMFRYRTCTHR